VLVSGTAGMSLATVIRMEFAYPGVGILAGDSIQYLSIATAHGVIMVFFMIMPAIFGAFGNFLLPTQLGVHDVAFPRLNSAAFWFLPGGLIMLCQLVCVDRRYQRMNCFNIRELQGILKRKFFTDLVNNSDSHKDMESTLVSMRHKNNMSNILLYDQSLFYNFDLTNTSKTKSFNYSPGKVYTYSNLPFSPFKGFNTNLLNNVNYVNFSSIFSFLLKDLFYFFYTPILASLFSVVNSVFFFKNSLTNVLFTSMPITSNILTVIKPGVIENNNTSSHNEVISSYNSSTVSYSTLDNLFSSNFAENSSS
jgi:hypothetical protein